MSIPSVGSRLDSRDHMLQLFSRLANIDALRLSIDVALLQRDRDHAAGGIETAQSLVDLQEVEIRDAGFLLSELERYVHGPDYGEGEHATHQA